MESLQNVRFSPLESERNTTSRRDIDRLSSLPDELLIHILSMVDIKLAVQTSIIISRINLWTMLPNLNIDLECLQPSEFSDNFLDRVLTLHNNSTKNVHINVSRTGQPDFKLVKRILTHASTCKVQHLSLDLERNVLVSLFPEKYSNCSSIFPYNTEPGLLVYGSLTSLTIKCAENCVSCPTAVHLQMPYFIQLTTLNLEKPNIVNSHFLVGCPNLQDLTLTHCCYSEVPPNLIISARKLSRFVLSYYESSVIYVKLMLKAPNLRFLKLEGPHSLFLVDNTLPLLDTVDINFLCLSPLNEHNKILIDMLECFHTVKSASLTWNTIQLLSMFPDMLVKRSSPFHNLESLRIMKSYWSKSFDKAIPAEVKTYLLKNSPCVEVIQ